MNKRSFLFFILLINSICSNAQQPYVINYTYPDVLNTPTVYDLYSAKNGYLWMATDKGLFKFNGRVNKQIANTNAKSYSYSFIKEDANGIIWCMNFFKEIFYVKNDSLQKLAIPKDVEANSGNYIKIFINANNLLLLTEQKLVSINPTTNQFTTLLKATKGDNFYDGDLGDNTVYITTVRAKLLVFKNNYTSTNQLPINDITTVNYFDNKLFITNRGNKRTNIYCYENNQLKTYPLLSVPDNVFIYQVKQVNNRFLWFTSSKGIWGLDLQSNLLQQYFADYRTTDIVTDFQGNYWISTADNGIYKLPNFSLQQIKAPLINNRFTRLVNANNSLVAANTTGDVYEFSNNQLNKLANYIKGNEIELLYYDSTTQQILFNGGVYNVKRKIYNTNEKLFGKQIVRALNNTFLMSGTYGGYVISLTTPVNNIYTNSGFLPSFAPNTIEYKMGMLRNHRATAVYYSHTDSTGYIAYTDGLFIYHYNKTAYQLYFNNQPISARHINEADSFLIISTSNNGVLFYNKKRQKITAVNQLNGISSNNVRKTIIKNNLCWIISDEGVDCYNFTTNKINSVTGELGINKIAIYDAIESNNKIYLATPDGIVVFDALLKQENRNILFSHLIAKADTATIINNQKLNYYQNKITLFFDAVDYGAKDNLIFKYQILPLDSSYKTVNGLTSELYFNNLMPASYTINIMALDKTKPNIFTTKPISFTIQKPYWQSFWFYLLLFIIVASVIWLIFQSYLNKIKRKQRVELQLANSKITALRSQMNPHFIYNVLNSVQGLVYGNKRKEASNVLSDFSDLMRKTLHYSDKIQITLKEELELIETYIRLEQIRFEDEFTYAIKLTLNHTPDELVIPCMIIQPFVENAFKHGLLHKRNQKQLNIEFIEDSDLIKVIVRDNGIGRKKAAEIANRNKTHSGFAVQSIKERVNLLSTATQKKLIVAIKDLTDNLGNALGTEVTILIPLKKVS